MPSGPEAEHAPPPRKTQSRRLCAKRSHNSVPRARSGSLPASNNRTSSSQHRSQYACEEPSGEASTDVGFTVLALTIAPENRHESRASGVCNRSQLNVESQIYQFLLVSAHARASTLVPESNATSLSTGCLSAFDRDCLQGELQGKIGGTEGAHKVEQTQTRQQFSHHFSCLCAIWYTLLHIELLQLAADKSLPIGLENTAPSRKIASLTECEGLEAPQMQ